MSLSDLFASNILVKWLRGDAHRHDLTVTMTGVKLGERLLLVGAADGSLLAALGAKTGLSGRACVVDDDQNVVASAAATAERAGVLAEAQAIEDDRIPFEDAAFDLVVVASALGLASASGSSSSLLAELARVLRPGGRVVAMVPVQAKGRLDAEAVGRESGVTAAVEALTAGGLRGARVLAATGGLAYVEAANPRA